MYLPIINLTQFLIKFTNDSNLTEAGHTDQLNQVKLPIVDHAWCSSIYPGQIFDSTLCAGYVEGGKDTCQGDSGGPLSCFMEAGRWFQGGVTSMGPGCAEPNKPGIYTNVAFYYQFINTIISGSLSSDLHIYNM